MKLACTGFVSATAGSVAGANALLLGKLLDRGFEIDFFSKPSFADPRPIVGSTPGFRFVPVNNTILNFTRERGERGPLVSVAAGVADTFSYNQLVIRRIREENRRKIRPTDAERRGAAAPSRKGRFFKEHRSLMKPPYPIRIAILSGFFRN